MLYVFPLIAAASMGLLAYLIGLVKSKFHFSFMTPKKWKKLGIDIGLGLAINYVLVLIIGVFSGGITGPFLPLLVAFLFVMFKPSNLFFKKSEGENINKRKIVFASLISLWVLVELFGLNYKSFKNYGSVQEVATSSMVLTKFQKSEDDFVVVDGCSFTFDVSEMAAEPKSLRFNFERNDNIFIKAKVSYLPTGENDFIDLKTYEMDGINVDYHLVRLPETKYDKLLVTFTTSTNHYLQTSTIVMNSVTFNAKPRVSINFVRVGLACGLIGVVLYTPLIFDYFKKKKQIGAKPYIVIGAIGIASFISAMIIVFTLKETTLVSYPVPEAQLGKMSTDIFVQLFDALRKGRVSLDIQPSDKLLALANPYDPSSRSGVSYLWDHAFYNGQYYSYYGALPVLLISFPIYWLTGGAYVPNAFALQLIGFAIIVPAFLILLLEIVRFIRKDCNYVLFTFISVIAFITSTMVMIVTFKKGYYHEAIYHVPDIYGLIFFDLYLAFLLRATRQCKHRMLNLALSGLFVVFTIASRPNLVVMLPVGAPFYIGMLVKKDKTIPQRIIDFIPMAVIVIAGAVVLGMYNYVRFGSFLEFGQSYQLTVADQTSLTYSLDKIYPTIIHFYYQGVAFYEIFPHISCSVMRFSFDNCPYVQGYTGTMLIPMFALTCAMAIVFFRKKETWDTRIFAGLFPILMAVFAFTTYSKAGLCARYIIEQYHLMTIAAIFTIVKLAQSTENDRSHRPVMLALGALMIFSAYECLCISYDGFDGMNAGDVFGLKLFFRSMFQEFNI